MIHHALEYLRVYLSRFVIIPSNDGGDTSRVQLANVATINDPEGEADDVLLISLVNLEEEFTRKNLPPLRREDGSGRINYRNPPVFLNLYALFCAKIDNYFTALRVLSEVIACIQAQHVFEIGNSGLDLNESDAAFSIQEELRFRIELELYSMTFEQLNHLWGTLGGKQYPSVMYKIRLVQLEKEVLHGRGQVIRHINLNSSAQ